MVKPEPAARTVAVIGLGAHGLVALKNLLEEGFDVTGFDSNSYVSGLWHYTPEAEVSCLQSTHVNVSRERACFTDFAFPDGTSSYPSGQEIDKYLNDFATEYKLWPYFRLNTRIQRVDRDDVQGKWKLEIKEGGKQAEIVVFDKLVIAAGPHSVPIEPTIPDSDQFKGEIIHSIAFKDPAQYKGKNVVVLGMGNTAVDTATILIGHAKTIYLAHRNGCVLLPRILNNGTSLDHGASYRTFAIRDYLELLFPKLAANFIDNWVRQIQDKHFDLKPEWRVNTPTPSLSKQNPTVSDTLYPALKDGSVISTHSIKKFTGSNSLELDDGTVLSDIDSVVLCTGYRLDLSYLGPIDPCDMTPDTDGPHQYDYNCPRLYRNLLSHSHPDSLAFVGLALLFFPAFTMADLTSQALAQLWKHPEQLPSQTEMQDHYAKHRAWRAHINAGEIRS
jgi:dimethylaniline monooxygenase (N-oxide forming)